MRSVAIHQRIAQEITKNPSVVRLALKRVQSWRVSGSVNVHYCDAWEQLLSEPIDALAAQLIADDEQMKRLRQVSPFAGVIDARERWRIWKDVRKASGV